VPATTQHYCPACIVVPLQLKGFSGTVKFNNTVDGVATELTGKGDDEARLVSISTQDGEPVAHCQRHAISMAEVVENKGWRLEVCLICNRYSDFY
jgi:hypothetical protein